MIQRYAAILFFVLCVGMVCGHAQDENTRDTIKVDTRLVSVPVIISDRNGRYVPNLTAADFTILQDGSPQRIEFFAAVEEPLTIALLIDTSQSTRPVLGDIKDSAKSFIRLLGTPDKAMIVSFDYTVHVLSELTSVQEQLKKAINTAEIPDRLFGTVLRDAAFETINRAFAGIKGRKAVIILTDGKDAGSRISSRELLYSLQETDTLVYTIMFKTGVRPPQNQIRFPRRGGIFGGRFPPNRRDNPRRNERLERINLEAEDFLRQLSDTTAGRFFASKDGKLKDTFATIVDELRFQYRIGFYPPDDTIDNVLHELKVKVSRPDAVVRSRGSYRIKNKN